MLPIKTKSYAFYPNKRLFDEFNGVPLESFFANKTAEMIGFTLIGDFKFCRIFVKNHAANWISK